MTYLTINEYPMALKAKTRNIQIRDDKDMYACLLQINILKSDYRGELAIKVLHHLDLKRDYL
jgi:hypothetical protein